MKLIATAIFAGILSISTAACAKEDSKKSTATPVAQEKKVEAPKTKTICKDAKDKSGKVIKNKDGSVKQNCKTIKIHKKYEGTKVPTK
jgi:hypothetical protein